MKKILEELDMICCVFAWLILACVQSLFGHKAMMKVIRVFPERYFVK